jgi:hypothetical protein
MAKVRCEVFLAGGIMKALRIIFVVAVVFSAALCQASGLTRAASVNESIMGKSLSLQSFLSTQLDVKGDQGDLRDDIYEFHAKSPAKAFFMSLVIPGAGQYYNGSRIKAGSFLIADVALWSGYLIYRGKGSNMETDYKKFADVNYTSSVYRDWWNGLDSTLQNIFSHRLYFDESGNPIKNREYYENIGKYDQFQVGWGSSGINHPPPTSPNDTLHTAWFGDNNERSTYLGMRKKSNDYFSNAKTMAMVSIANHVISAFEAAISARRLNKGGKQYSMELETRNIDGRVVPFAMARMKF